MVANGNPWVQAFRIFRPMGYPAAFILDIDPISIVNSQFLRCLGVDVKDRVRTLGPQALYLSEIGMPINSRLSGGENEGILIRQAQARCMGSQGAPDTRAEDRSRPLSMRLSRIRVCRTGC